MYAWRAHGYKGMNLWSKDFYVYVVWPWIQWFYKWPMQPCMGGGHNDNIVCCTTGLTEQRKPYQAQIDHTMIRGKVMDY